jgi:hypothetical protein
MANGNPTLYPHIDVMKDYDIYRKSNPQDHDVHVKGIPYAFITTPKLNLSEANISRDNFLIHMQKEQPDLFEALTAKGSKISPFIKLLTNTFRGIDGKDLAARTLDINETFYGYKQTLPISIVDSQVGDTVTLRFEEFKYLPVVKMHKLWVEYTEKVRRGFFSPSEDAVKKRYIDYVSSIYYFVLDMDGETILYWAKYTGAVPISVPYSALVTDGKEHDIPEIGVEYVYSFKEDMDPSILMDFNKVSTLDSSGLKYSEDTFGKPSIPYMKNDMLPYNFTEEQIRSSKVLVVKQDAYRSDSVTPKNRYTLRFLN